MFCYGGFFEFLGDLGGRIELNRGVSGAVGESAIVFYAARSNSFDPAKTHTRHR